MIESQSGDANEWVEIVPESVTHDAVTDLCLAELAGLEPATQYSFKVQY